jgi:hypothetical protein
MSFRQAFADARRELGAGRTFNWRGSSYTTNYAEEEGSSRRSSPRPVEEVRRSASAAIDRAEGRPRTTPQPNPRRRPGPNEGTATRVDTANIQVSRLPAIVQREIESAPTAAAARRAAEIAERGTQERVPGRAILIAIRNFFRGSGPTDPAQVLRQSRDGQNVEAPAGDTPARNTGSRGRRGMAKGGMAKKRGYAKGGMVKANCGASMKPNGKSRK